MKKMIVLLCVFLVGCSILKQDKDQSFKTSPTSMSTSTNQPTTIASLADEETSQQHYIELVNLLITKYNQRTENDKVVGLKEIIPLFTEDEVLTMLNETEQSIDYGVALQESYQLIFSYDKQAKDSYNAILAVNLDLAKQETKSNFQEEMRILQELEVYLSNYKNVESGAGFKTAEKRVDVKGYDYSPIVSYDGKVTITSKEDLLWFYEEGFVVEKSQEIIKTITSPFDTEEIGPSMIVELNGLPYRYQCDCGLSQMNWIEVIPDAIVGVENKDDLTKVITVAGIFRGELSVLKQHPIVEVTVKFEDGKWKIDNIKDTPSFL